MNIEEYYETFMQEVITGADAADNYSERQFVQLMAEEIETSGYIDGFHDCAYKTSRGIRADGYYLMKEEGILNLFISVFYTTPSLQIVSLTKTEVDAAFKRLENFFTQCIQPGFYQKLEESSPGYDMANVIYSNKNSFSRVNLFLLSNGQLSDRVKDIEKRSIDKYSVSYNIWDLSRIFRLESSRSEREDLVIDFKSKFDQSLPCLPAHVDSTAYKAYLIVIPGNMLADLYDTYGARLLESNVRCFLQFRGNVNKGIRNTILNSPDMFFAYNNGITATAESVDFENNNNGPPCIKKLKNLQIVNGGQTTASIFSVLKKDKADLSKIFVQMKLSIIDAEKYLEVVPEISKCANTQNKVNAADFFANHPFHIRMEEFSRRLWAPSKDGTIQETKWFYERARGQYLDAQSNLTQTEKKKFQIINLKQQMFRKTDLAKFENVWEYCPHIVSLGAQKNFADYAKKTGSKWDKDKDCFNETYFKEVVAKCIIFKTTEKMVSAQPGTMEATELMSLHILLHG